MSKTPWTPGPWEWNDKEYFQQFSGEFSSTAVYAPGNAFPWRMCEVQGPDDETEIANARLIAAAPEMAEALEACADYIDRLAHAHPQVELLQARAALAKARGNQ